MAYNFGQWYAPQNNAINYVQGETGARAYMVAPGSTALLMDSENKTFYIKSADASGLPSLRIFDYTERVQTQDNGNITRTEYGAICARIDALTARMDKYTEVNNDAK